MATTLFFEKYQPLKFLPSWANSVFCISRTSLWGRLWSLAWFSSWIFWASEEQSCWLRPCPETSLDISFPPCTTTINTKIIQITLYYSATVNNSRNYCISVIHPVQYVLARYSPSDPKWGDSVTMETPSRLCDPWAPRLGQWASESPHEVRDLSFAFWAAIFWAKMLFLPRVPGPGPFPYSKKTSMVMIINHMIT